MDSRKNVVVIILITLVITVLLGIAAWDINFWPTDVYHYYFSAALNVPHLDHISQIHKSIDGQRVKWLHGKEMVIWTASLLQRLLQDFKTLRPFLLLCLISFAISSIALYLIASRYWGSQIGLVCYLFFITSFWPYVYILFAKHHLVGLMFFLLAILLLRGTTARGKICYLLSGTSLCCAFFSSTIAALYIPFYIGAFIYAQRANGGGLVTKLALVATGGGVTFLYFTYPNVVYNVKAFLEYVEISSSYNHFYYNQPVLQQWIPDDIAGTRGGWLWVIKYFFLIMPVLFPVYLLSLIYLIFTCFKTNVYGQRHIILTITLILLSCSVPLLAELRGVAQYGGNYFGAIIGIIMLIGYTISKLKSHIKFKPAIYLFFVFISCTQIGVNSYVFASDIFPTRMATTILSERIKSLGVKEFYTYRRHPYVQFIHDKLNPDVRSEIRFLPIDTIMQPESGYILVPPVSEDSIYLACCSDYINYDVDIFLNELIRKGNIDDYALYSLKTMTSSRIWPHEAESLSYRYLILNEENENNETLGKLWILDAEKIRADFEKNTPGAEVMHLVQNDVRNIGTKQRTYMYRGLWGEQAEPSSFTKYLTRMYKVGNPTDSLVAYVYRLSDEQGESIWLPEEPRHVSKPVQASTITSDPQGGLAVFEFPRPVSLEQGQFRIMIYRTEEGDNNNFYRIYKQFHKRINDDAPMG